MGKKVRSDFHNHWVTGGPNWNPSERKSARVFNRAIDAAARALGPGGILGLASFNKNGRCEQLYNARGGYDREMLPTRNGFYVPDKKIVVVKCQELEVATEQGLGEILAIGVQMDSQLQVRRAVRSAVQEAQGHGAIIELPHLFHFRGLGPYLLQHPDILEQVDAIETDNGEANLGIGLPIVRRYLPPRANSRALQFYEQTVQPNHPDVGALATSDGHSAYEIGSGYTKIDQPRLDDNFTTDLRASIRKARPEDQKPSSRIVGMLGAADHMADMLFLIKIGLG